MHSNNIAVFYTILPLMWENLSRRSTKLIHFCRKLPLELDSR